MLHTTRKWICTKQLVLAHRPNVSFGATQPFWRSARNVAAVCRFVVILFCICHFYHNYQTKCVAARARVFLGAHTKWCVQHHFAAITTASAKCVYTIHMSTKNPQRSTTNPTRDEKSELHSKINLRARKYDANGSSWRARNFAVK